MPKLFISLMFIISCYLQSVFDGFTSIFCAKYELLQSLYPRFTTSLSIFLG